MDRSLGMLASAKTKPKLETEHKVFVGTAAWGIPKDSAEHFARVGSALERYSSVFRAVEINSTFYRRHQAKTFERWASVVPDDFRFAVKMAKTITHEAKLEGVGDLLQVFFEDVKNLGEKLGPILVQLAPSLKFEPKLATQFWRGVRRLHAGSIAFEPRHISWYQDEATKILNEFSITRVIADPASPKEANEPAGSGQLTYLRLHGSPRIYWSSYSESEISDRAKQMSKSAEVSKEVWCIFDNTASGAATQNALQMMARWKRA